MSSTDALARRRVPAPTGARIRARSAGTSAWQVAALAFLASRLVVWGVGLAAIALVGLELEPRFDPFGTTVPRDGLGHELLAPAARWDAGWYLAIARDGYLPDPHRAAFFPLYPLLVRGLGTVLGVQLAGLLISCTAGLVALALLHRLTELELGRPAATRTVLLVAFFPTSLFLSAIYTESLFLALTVGCLLAARHRRWALAGLLGALAAATRNSGVLLLVPLVLLLVRPPSASGWRRPGPEAAWLLLVPAGLAAAVAYVASDVGSVQAMLDAQREGWGRAFAGPLAATWDAVAQTRISLREILGGATLTAPNGAGAGLRNAPIEFAAFVGALVALVGAFRRLPVAYGAYAAAALLLAVSFPVDGAPFMSVPRYVLVLFPLFMWLGAWTAARGRPASLAIAAVWVVGLAAAAALFTTWRFVG